MPSLPRPNHDFSFKAPATPQIYTLSLHDALPIYYSGQWWIWVVLMTVIVFLLTYRDVRLSTTAGVILGAFEIIVFAGLSLWMLISNAGDINLQPFNPSHASGGFGGVLKGMIFAILAFIGFEAADRKSVV